MSEGAKLVLHRMSNLSGHKQDAESKQLINESPGGYL